MSEIRKLQQIIAATDSLSAAFRTNAHIPIVADTAIMVVSDSATCAHALRTYNANTNHSGSGASAVYAIRAGPVFVVSNDNPEGLEFTLQMVMDRKFHEIGGYLG